MAVHKVIEHDQVTMVHAIPIPIDITILFPIRGIRIAICAAILIAVESGRAVTIPRVRVTITTVVRIPIAVA